MIIFETGAVMMLQSYISQDHGGNLAFVMGKKKREKWEKNSRSKQIVTASL